MDHDKVKEMFLHNGIYACVAGEDVVIFPTKHLLSNIKMAEEDKEMLVFTYASRTLLED